jgi:4-carboxymuconolactone decarboxylase
MPAPKFPPTTIAAVKDIVPKLAELTEKVLFGDVWRALDNSVTREELSELCTHLAFYAGWANGISAAQVAKPVYEERSA